MTGLAGKGDSPVPVRRHNRSLLVAQAENEIRAYVWKVQGDLDITNVELLQILAGMQRFVFKYMIRTERHPNKHDTTVSDES